MAGRINYLSTMLRGKDLKDFDEVEIQSSGTTSAHLKLIQEGLLGYFPPSMPYPRKSARCAAQCTALYVNLETFHSSVFPHDQRNLIITYRSYLD